MSFLTLPNRRLKLGLIGFVHPYLSFVKSMAHLLVRPTGGNDRGEISRAVLLLWTDIAWYSDVTVVIWEDGEHD